MKKQTKKHIFSSAVISFVFPPKDMECFGKVGEKNVWKDKCQSTISCSLELQQKWRKKKEKLILGFCSWGVRHAGRKGLRKQSFAHCVSKRCRKTLPLVLWRLFLCFSIISNKQKSRSRCCTAGKLAPACTVCERLNACKSILETNTQGWPSYRDRKEVSEGSFSPTFFLHFQSSNVFILRFTQVFIFFILFFVIQEPKKLFACFPLELCNIKNN